MTGRESGRPTPLPFTVIPAKAGIQCSLSTLSVGGRSRWIPASARMTGESAQALPPPPLIPRPAFA
jgi:hypothetical protein